MQEGHFARREAIRPNANDVAIMSAAPRDHVDVAGALTTCHPLYASRKTLIEQELRRTFSDRATLAGNDVGMHLVVRLDTAIGAGSIERRVGHSGFACDRYEGNGRHVFSLD